MKKLNLLFMVACGILLTNSAFSQIIYPGGDTCSSAIPIGAAMGYETLSDGAGSDHWYEFTAPCDGELYVTDAGDNESDKRIYSGVCGSLTELAGGSWAESSISHPMSAGATVKVKINDSWDGVTQFNIEYTGCVAVDSALLDVSGFLYYDMNNNGIRDGGDIAKPYSPLTSDPLGMFAVSGVEGFYYSVVTDVEDGVYEFSPHLGEHWGVSTDSAFYTIIVEDAYVQRDSLDFGIYPDTLIHQVNAELIGGFPRCNDTIIYKFDIQNTGTTIASGVIDLELDDSLYYVSCPVAPDSIIGQHYYWHYDNLFFGAHHLLPIYVGTPDGLADTVSSDFKVTAVDSIGVVAYIQDETFTQIITCAYDPNDKTPTPLGEGEFGYIDPATESLEYLIRFQNTGTDTAFNVVITDQLDDNLDWNSIMVLSNSHFMTYDMTPEGEVSFIFDNIMLPDSNVDVTGSQGYVKFTIDLVPGLPLETSLLNTAYIYFDFNPAVITNTAINTLHVEEEDNSGIEELTAEQVVVYPNPFSETTTVYFGEDLANYSVQILDLSGRQVYLNTELTGNQLELDATQFNAGMYVLVLIYNTSNETVSTTKIVVQ